jgi:hypothetical protein
MTTKQSKQVVMDILERADSRQRIKSMLEELWGEREATMKRQIDNLRHMRNCRIIAGVH